MKSILATCAAVALTAAFAMPVPAAASEKRAGGVRNAEYMDVSAKKKRRHVQRRYYGPRYGYRYGHRPYRYAPYYAYAPAPYYHRPYYRPGVSVGVGPFGFGFGF